MSQLERVSISGIRSFENSKNGETINFQTPLTLIVGPNGTGKTTIIECLKYATTGSLPPNSAKGAAFIHDPGLAGDKEVYAFVKFLFKNASKNQMLIERRQMLTVKKTTRTVKTLEGTFKMRRNAETQVVTSKVGELDRLIPQSLGVSKAVLEHVIFCHQDESAWPLSEPSALKKKFDEIFEAQKYTRALDKIKDIRKKKGIDLQKLKLVNQQAKETKIRADKADKDARRISTEIDHLQAEIDEMDEKSRDALAKYEHAYDEAAKYNANLQSLEGRRQQRSFTLASVRKIEERLKVRTESDEWLRSELENYAERVQARQQRDTQLRNQHQELVDSIKELHSQADKKGSEIGRLQLMHEEHEKRKDERKALVKETSQKHRVRGFENALDDVRIGDFLVKVQNLLKERQDSIKQVRQQREADASRQQQKLDEFRKQQNTLENEQNFAKSQIAEDERKIKELRSQISHIKVDEGEVAILDSQVEDLEASVQRADSDHVSAAYDEQLQTTERRIQSLSDQMGHLGHELRISTDRQNEIAERDLIRRGVTENEKKLEKMRAVHTLKLKALFDHDWNPATLKPEFMEAVAQRSRRVNEAERSRAAANRDLEQVDMEISRVQQEIAKMSEEVANCETRLRAFLDGPLEDYPEEFQKIQNGRDQLKSDLEGAGHVRGFYERAITMAEEKHKCRLCNRKFEDEAAEQKFFDLLRKKLAKDDDAGAIQQDLTRYEVLLTKARDGASAFETWQKLTKVILPQQRQTEKDVKSKRIGLVRRLEEHDEKVSRLEQEKEDLDAFDAPVQNISKCHDEIVNLSAKLKEILKRQQSADLPRALKDLQAEHSSLTDQINAAREVKQKLSDEKGQSRLSVRDLEANLAEAKTELDKAHRSLNEKTDKIRQIEELISGNASRRDQIQAIDSKLQDLLPHIETTQDDLAGFSARSEQAEDRLNVEATALTEVVRRLKEANNAIQEYISAGGKSTLERCQREKLSIEQQRTGTEDEKNNIIKSLNKIKEELASQEKIKQDIRDNLDYRGMKQDLESLEREITSLEAQSEEADREKWNAEGNLWRNRHNDYNRILSTKTGEHNAKKEIFVDLKRNYATEYKDAAKLAKNAHIEVEATRAAIDDLARYGSALDKAIMKFHGLKMAEINRIVEELWTKTYKGTDVDRILIRSDSEGARANQSYNYRVCMMKGDVEMDMRGRCSAGQRVLASIIIRLALAECFGVNCGLIALDEPTTNLDSENITALASALHELIEARRHQANFQLIIITHDEEFINSMRPESFTDTYLRLSRNEHEKTVIMRQRIKDLTKT